MGQILKVFIAGSTTWIAGCFAYGMIASAADGSSLSGYFLDDGWGALLSVLPPLVVLLGFLLFRWAIGNAFSMWLSNIRPNVSTVIIVSLLSATILTSGIAASNSADARGAASGALSYAEEASTYAQDAASTADDAASACRFR
ncbi:MAG: hypothetical protein O2817_07550 [Proteobacteria bacterium]|nr:hypothetical protein [Pseudomonadota bacterium]